jgi:hypothetical protein
MITAIPHNYSTRADSSVDCSFGNILFVIAGIIGIATKNRYSYGFHPWANQEFFVNKLPEIENKPLRLFQNPITFKGYDVGFAGFNIPDNVCINGYFGSGKYFEHCKGLIRYYFTMKDLCEPYKDCILIHCRNYKKETTNILSLERSYYIEALKKFPSKKVVVITDNIAKAKDIIKEDFEYVSNTPIIDFYLLTKAEYLIMGNSTFSWWGAWLSGAKTIAPLKWYAGHFENCPTKDLYCDEWEII